MPYAITSDPAGVRIVLSGVITHQDLQALAQELAVRDASQGVTPHRLTDLSAMTAPYPTFPDVRALVERRKGQALANAVKSALVAPRPILLGFARMYQQLHAHPQITIEIFASIVDAEAWLRAA